MRTQADVESYPDLHAALEQLLAAGGKRVRPTIVLLAGSMLGADQDKLVTLGAAVEMAGTSRDLDAGVTARNASDNATNEVLGEQDVTVKTFVPPVE